MKKIFLPVLFLLLFGAPLFSGAQPVASVSPTSITANVLCGDSTTIPLTISNTGSSNLTYDILSSGSGLAGDSSVLVIQESDAWTVYMNTFFQTNFGVTPTVITSSQIASTNFMLYDIVITVGDESTTYYTNISNNVAKFEAFANAGGIVQYQMATQGGTNVNLVGGAIMMYGNNETQNTGLIMSHPILNGLTNPLNGSSANHCYITNVPVGAQILTQTAISMVPTTIEYTYGNGRVIATGMTWEWLSVNTSYNASPMLMNACTYSLSLINPIPSWLSFSQTTGTVIPSGNSVVDVNFNASNLTAGTYTNQLAIVTNDPSNDTIFVPCTLTVSGQPLIVLSASSFNFGSLQIGAMKTDSVTISNNGCDSLIVSNIVSSAAQFTFAPANMVVPPYGNQKLYITFSPSSITTYNDSITVFNNSADKIIYVNGSGVPVPVISVSPSPLAANVLCGDSATVALTISNTGGSNLTWSINIPSSFYDDFDPSIDTSLWSDTTGGSANTLCGSLSGNALMFDGNTTRMAVTKDLNTVNTSAITFYIKISNVSGTCEDADAGEDVILQYSTNGGGTWTNLQTLNVDMYPNFTLINQTLPSGAKTSSTRFRWYQPTFSGSCCDHWALDNVSINGAGFVTASPLAGTTVPAGNSIVNVVFNASGLNAGQYISSITVVSNDPMNGTIVIPCTLTVSSQPLIVLSTNSINFGSLLVGAMLTDSVTISNNGCDSLIVSNIVSSAPEFTFTPANMVVAPFSSKKLFITFSPSSITTYNDSITVFNNSADKIIYVNGSGAPAPVISVSPDSLNATILCGDSTTSTFTIYNTGGINLNYQLTAGGGGSNGTITYSEAFVSGLTPTTQVTAWVNFRNQLTAKPYNKLKVSGSVNPAGVTLTEPTLVANIANAMNTMTAYTVTYAGNTWTVNVNGCNNGVILTVNAPVCACDAASPTLYVLRPEIGNANWGGINTATCSAPSQTMIVEFTYGTPFIEFSPTADTVVSGDSSVVNVTFNASGLSSGIYTGYILVSSNDPVNDTIFVPCTLTVIGQVNIVLSSNTINFGSLMVGDSQTDSITVNNSGCDTLFISAISSSSGDFNASMGNFVIPPYSSQILYVTFTPSSVMNYNDSLIIFSNDTNAVVYLNGTGAPAPVISVSPDSLNATVLCGDSVTTTLTIYNTGGVNLNYQLSAGGGGANGTITYSEAFVSGQTATTQVTAWVNFRNQLTAKPYNKLKVSGSVNPTGVTLTDPVLVANIANAMNTMTAYTVTDGGNTWDVNINGCNNGVILTVNAPVCACDAASPTLYVLRPEIGNSNWGGINTATCSAPSQTMTVEFTYGTPFIQFTPSADTVVSGDSSVVDVTFDGSGLNAGTYTGYILVSSNDLTNDSILVPCTLTVTGTPVMVLSDTCIFFGNVLQGDTVSAFVTITNTGCADLNIGNIVAPANFDASPASFTLSPDSSYSVEVLFSPTAITTYTGNITIFSNAGNQNVCVSGTGVAAPDISASPASISVSLASCGDSSVWPLVISNTGAGPLDYIIAGGSLPGWMTVSPSSDSVSSGGSSSIAVTFNSTGLNGGQYTGNIIINSNDPDESPILIPCTLNVSFNPCANFIVSNSSACTGSVTFADSTSNTPTSWNWVFGDGGTSTLQNPTHVYGVSGTFPVQLIVCNGFGCDTLVQNITVLSTGGPAAACTTGTTGYCCGMGIYNVTFNTINNTTSDGIDGYKDYTCTYSTNVTRGQSYSISVQTGVSYNENVKVWIDFNNNAAFDVAELVFDSPNLLINHTGSISIPMSAVTNLPLRMRVMSDYYINTLDACTNVTYGQAEDYTVVVVPPPTPPVSNFNYFMPSACGATVIFADSSANNPTSWSWNFGNGDTSNLQNPTYTYAAVGNYAVQLTVCNSYGCDTYMQTIGISVIGAVTAACIPTTTSNCCGIGIYNVTFVAINNSSGDGSEGYQDYTCFTGTSVNSGQSYLLSITTGTSVNENVRAWIDYNNNGIFESGEQVFSSNNQLTNHSGVVVISNSSVISVPLRMRVGSDYFSSPAPSPCTNAIQGQFEDYAVTVLPNNAPPIAAFSSSVTDTCLGVVQFTDLSSNNPTSWSWTFGDGGASAQQNPTHTYSASGTYSVTLIASNGFGSDTITSSIAVTSLSVSFTTSGSYEPGAIITFTGTSSGASSWIWQFGDGNTASIQNPLHSYADTGVYTVIVTVTAANGCSAQYSQTIGIYPTGISVAGDNGWGFVVYPNPNKGKFNLIISGLENLNPDNYREGKLKIYNLLGEIVYQSVIYNHQSTIVSSNLSSGIYYIQLSSEKGVLTKRVVVE